MAYNRLPLKDPRTISREIPGIFEIIFPHLNRGTVGYFNSKIEHLSELEALPDDYLKVSQIQHAMLFEIALARSEQTLKQLPDDWDKIFQIAINRQKRHFDAQPVDKLSSNDVKIVNWASDNLVKMLKYAQSIYPDHKLIYSPRVVGYQWIASGEGDFSLGNNLIEVKCTDRNFGSADYRQILMYWLLSYAFSIERNTGEWERIILINPRKNNFLNLSFNEIIEVTSAGKSKVEIIELFHSIVGDLATKEI